MDRPTVIDRYAMGDVYGVRDTLLTYICSEGKSNRLSKADWLPSVAYMKDGQIRDTLFDSFVILPSPNYLYNYGSSDFGLKPLTKADWLRYITDEQFAAGVNLDAVDEAVGDVRRALGKNDYKVTIFLSLFYPVKSVASFGEVDGKNLCLANPENRKSAVKWMVEEHIRQFKARNYQHLRLGGFYWYYDALEADDADMEGILSFITAHVRARGYITTWIPFFLAPGCDRAHALGFDLIAMQANYFHGPKPNAGGKDRLAQMNALIKEQQLGVCLELGGDTGADLDIFKDYLSAGAELGYIHAYHMYYMGGGPDEVAKLACSDREEIRSGYDDLYNFIKKIL